MCVCRRHNLCRGRGQYSFTNRVRVSGLCVCVGGGGGAQSAGGLFPGDTIRGDHNTLEHRPCLLNATSRTQTILLFVSPEAEANHASSPSRTD